MKLPRSLFFISLLTSFLAVAALAQNPATEASPPIDFNKARALFQREQAGEKLNSEEAAYLARAKELRRQQASPGGGGGGRAQRPKPERLIPLTDLTGDKQYEGQEGGLYGNGANEPPATLREKAMAELAKIQPLAADGKPAADGRIVFISISMSNATQEFSRFKQLADRSDQKAAHTVVVDCAQGGQAMAEWAPPNAPPWQVAGRLLENAKVSPLQVQVAWVKLANKGPTGSLEEHCRKLEADTLRVLQNAKARFPNLRIAYLGSRIWGGNAKGGLNPEPYAYESAFPARWLIQRQMKGSDTELTLEKAPLLLWGPYLWAEGERGRKIDDLKWLPGDFSGDGVHPSESGRDKVGNLLLDFVTTDPLAKSWFTGRPAK
jgi:hypothetical protein